jgi:hypothetical protein
MWHIIWLIGVFATQPSFQKTICNLCIHGEHKISVLVVQTYIKKLYLLLALDPHFE